MFNLNKVASVATLVFALFSGMAIAGEKVTVKDITGRDVQVSVPVERVILGEGRQILLHRSPRHGGAVQAHHRLAG